MTAQTTATIPLRARLAMYGVGLFCDGATNVVIPLWALYLEPSPFAFGIVIGARSLLPFLLSIHGGVLMDRLGARQVMLFFAVIGLIVPVAFPLLPWIWVAGLLNLILGLSATMNWVGAQTLVAQAIRSDPSLTWHVTFCNRFGHFICPMLAGVMWDMFGPWGGFGVTFVWAVGFMAAALMLPHGAGTASKANTAGPRFAPRDLLPRLEDYRRAFKLMSIPLVAVVMVGSVLNISTGGIQISFFVAYMKEIGLSGTLIGMIFAIYNLSGLFGTASMTPISRRLGDVRILNITIVVALVAITITPLLGSFVALALAQVTRGFVQGIGQPLMIMIPSKMVPIGSVGTVIGLRVSLNRLMQTVLPPLMGGVVGIVGLNNSFYVIGGLLIATSLALWVIFRPPVWTPSVNTAAEK